MTKREIAAATGFAVLMASATVGCSSGSAKPKPGVLQPGTAHVTVGDKDAGTTGAVRCAEVRWTKTIKTGDDTAGTVAMLSEQNKLTVEYVRIRNINGFNGDYDLNLNGSAAVGMTDNTYNITGTVFGFGPTSIAPTTQPFTIKVAC